jgi:hypothetical protein
MPRRSQLDLDVISAITSAQCGLITARQLVDAGVSRSTVHHRIRTGGPWRRLLPGLYLVTGGRPDRDQMRMAALLYGGPTSVLTGLDALVIHDVRRVVPADVDPVHVLVAHGTRRTSTGFVTIERTRRVTAPVVRNGLPIAPVERAVVDAARRMTRRSDVAALMSQAMQGRHTTVFRLDAEVRAAHRRSTALLVEVMADITAGTRSAPESALRRAWLASGLEEPLWNPTLLQRDGTALAVPDAYVVTAGVAVEVDSVEFHANLDDWRHTMERHARMSSHGVVVIATPPSRITRDPDGLLRQVAAAVRAHDGRRTPDIRILSSRTGSR